VNQKTFSFDCFVALRNPLELCFRLKYSSLVKYSLVMFCRYTAYVILDLTLLLEPSDCVFSHVSLVCFAVADPVTSRRLTNSVAASEFPSGKLCKNNELEWPENLLLHFLLCVGLYPCVLHFSCGSYNFHIYSQINFSVFVFSNCSTIHVYCIPFPLFMLNLSSPYKIGFI